jgi:hypothetical protein
MIAGAGGASVRASREIGPAVGVEKIQIRERRLTAGYSHRGIPDEITFRRTLSPLNPGALAETTILPR